MKRTGAEVLADALTLNASDLIFHVPGESFMRVLDAISIRRPEVRLITCRHEGSMAVMAEAYGKLTGRPGIAFVTRSPGATNAVNGVHTAYQDSSPMILFVGQVRRGLMEREAFMAYDFRQVFGPMTKWVAQIDDATRIPEFIQRAFHTAMSGRPGPVVLVIPEDVLDEDANVTDARALARAASAGTLSHAEMEELRRLLADARRPVIIVGGANWDLEARNHIQRFAAAHHIPIVTTFRRRDIIDHRHECYAGEIGIGANPQLLSCMRETDLVLVLNDALSDVNTIGQGYMEGFTLFDVPHPAQKLIHIHPSADELNRVYQADMAVIADASQVARMLAEQPPFAGDGWSDWCTRLRRVYEEDYSASACPGALDLSIVFRWLRTRLPPDAILTNGVGAYAGWSQRYFQHYQPHTQLGPISGSMGYGLPAAISAKLCFPDRVVVATAGDGCFLMSSDELATAKKYGVRVVVLVINNNMYGTIRIHQETKFDGRAVGTDLTNPDFPAYAKAFGAFGERVERTEEFPAAFERALACSGPALIELAISPDAIHTRYSLNALKERREQATRATSV